MSYKLIAIDIDDTLLNDELAVSEGTKQALAEAVERGVIVTLATGRMYPSAKKIASQLELNVPIITYQGAVIRNLLDEVTLYERSVPTEAVKKIYEYTERNDLHFQIYFEDRLYSKSENQWIEGYIHVAKIPYIVPENFTEFLDKPLSKLIIIDEPARLDAIMPELHEILGDSVYMTKSKPHYLEFMHPEGTKGKALTYLARHYGCDLSEVIAVGDSWNDHDMLETAGLGVAMGNAVEPLKQIADYVTASNNEEGVKLVVEKFILQR